MRVIKLGGRVQEDPSLPSAIAAAWARGPGALCVVHGGGDEISALQRAMGTEPVFSAGRRITTRGDMAIIRMALSGAINKRLVARLLFAGVHAVGISGEDAALLSARPLAPATMGRVGTPERVNVAFLRHLLDGGYLPVISPVSRDWTDERGEALNVNGDDAAAAIAVAAGAEELLFMADVDGLLIDGHRVPVIDADVAAEAIASGIACDGMAAKLQAGLTALEGGVERVRIGTIASLAEEGGGTLLVGVGSFA